MKFLSSEKLSAHKYKTPEGYLICTDAILARTGKQTYRKCEVFSDAADDDSEIEIDRKAEEVFAPATLASFENKPITVEHPDENVGPDNYNDLSVGFVRDVRRGEVDGQEVMLGTLVITDAQTIEEIENGEHTDLSCGYDCDIADEANPQQRNIRGNHVALCEQGRAGIARIVDSVKDANRDINSIKEHFKTWGYPSRNELQEIVNFYKLSRAEIEKIFENHYDKSDYDKLTYKDSCKDSDIPVGKLIRELNLNRYDFEQGRADRYSFNELKNTIIERYKVSENEAKEAIWDFQEYWQNEHGIHDSRFVIYNDDDAVMGRHPTLEAAKAAIKELKNQDKKYGNPFEEHYRIEIEDDLYGLIKEPEFRYYMITALEKSEKWGDEEYNVYVKAKNESEAKEKFKRESKDEILRIVEGNHSEYLKFKSHRMAIDSKCKDDIVFSYTKEDLEKAKAMYEKATEEHEKQLLKTLVDKIEFELKSREMSDSKCKDTKYGIISAKAWDRGLRKPQVVEYDLESAKRLKFSMENTDRIRYVIFNMDTNEFVDSIKDSDLSLLREYFNEKQPNRKMELRTKLKSMGYEEGVSGVNSSSIMWVRLNGKRYEVKNLSNVSPLDSVKDGGFQEIGNYWKNLERKNPGIEKIYEEFRRTPTFQNWDMKNSMDIIYSEEMFPKFEQFYKQKTGKNIIDSIKDEFPKITTTQEQELKKYGERFGYDWSEIMDGLNSRVNRENMKIYEAIEDLKETMTAQKSLYDSIKDSYYVVACEEGDYWFNEEGKPDKISKARRFNSYEEADRWRRQKGSGSVQKINDSIKDEKYYRVNKDGLIYLRKENGELIGPFYTLKEASEHVGIKYNDSIKDAQFMIRYNTNAQANEAVRVLKRRGFDVELIYDTTITIHNATRTAIDYAYDMTEGIASGVRKDSIKDDDLDSLRSLIKREEPNNKGELREIYMDWCKREHHGVMYEDEFRKMCQEFGFTDSIKDVDPREGESKEDFIARFMSETKEEYPDEKQRFAVANSYWERKHTKDSKYTIRYVDNDTVYIKKVKAKSKLDAIKKFKK